MEKNLQSTTSYRKYLIICISIIFLQSHHIYAQPTDTKLLRTIYGGSHPSFKTPANIITKSAYPISFALPVAEYIYGMASHRKEHAIKGLQMATGLAVTIGCTYLLKYTIQRQRPYNEHPEIVPYENDNSYSFPSGHTAAAFSTATSLSLQYRKWYIIAPSFLWAGAVGYCRIYEGMHYPTDIFAGAVVGAGSAWASYKVQKMIEKKWLHKLSVKTF